jgi:N-acetylmuramoyl-L-alanine amidase
MSPRTALLAAAVSLAVGQAVTSVAVPSFAQQPPAPGRARIVHGDGRPEEQITILESGMQVWLSARDLSAVIGAPRYWRSDLKRLVLRTPTHELALVVDSEVAILDRTTPLHLPAPVLMVADAVWIPIELLLDAETNELGVNGLGGASPWFDLPIRWNPAERRLDAGAPGARLVAVTASGEGPGRLDAIIDGAWDWRLAAVDRERIVVRLIRVSLPDSVRLPATDEPFSGLSATPIPEGIEIAFTPPPEAVGYRIQRLDRPARLSVVLSDDPADLGAGRMSPFPRSAGVDLPVFGQEGERSGGIDTVVLDPAGGGTAGIRAKGVSESAAMLELAQDVARRLTEELGLTVHLTRDADRRLSDEERVSIANSVGADLFISLHCDAHPSPAVSGPRAVVARPRAGPRAGVPAELAELGFTAWGEGQREHLPRSYRLADRLVTELSAGLDQPSRGVEEWPLPLLDAAAMPAAYLEVATLTAPGGEKRLREDRGRMVTAIVRAIDRYRRENP